MTASKKYLSIETIVAVEVAGASVYVNISICCHRIHNLCQEKNDVVAISPHEQTLKQYIVHFILLFQCDSLMVIIAFYAVVSARATHCFCYSKIPKRKVRLRIVCFVHDSTIRAGSSFSVDCV